MNKIKDEETKILKKVQMSETYLIGVLLAIVGGFLDTYSYLLRGHVFANAQTGNMVLFGVQIYNGNWHEAMLYFVPIFAFFIGIVICQSIKIKYNNMKIIHWRQLIVLAEIILLIIVAFLKKGEMDVIANTLVSFVCSIQVQSFRKVNGHPFATTMCTGNLRSASENICYYLHNKERKHLEKAKKYLGIISFFIGGAILGAFLGEIWGIKSILICCILLLVVFVLMFTEEKVIKINE